MNFVGQCVSLDNYYILQLFLTRAFFKKFNKKENKIEIKPKLFSLIEFILNYNHIEQIKFYLYLI